MLKQYDSDTLKDSNLHHSAKFSLIFQSIPEIITLNPVLQSWHKNFCVKQSMQESNSGHIFLGSSISIIYIGYNK